ncbi:MAG: hypothetical protein CMJ81_06285 [Planctomycetaceae bacterium]|nr:hypothetical protein [Planctomycetaceae bacterium]MBP60508.1 hypothetical protein [Planctomycetaceae bacterium]
MTTQHQSSEMPLVLTELDRQIFEHEIDPILPQRTDLLRHQDDVYSLRSVASIGQGDPASRSFGSGDGGHLS